MTFDDFIEQIPIIALDNLNIERHSEKASLLNNEALFQLPLICLIILSLSKSKRKPQISEIGQLVGECIEASFDGFKGSAQHIGWSANLRIRTIKAVNFLEQKKIIEVNQRTQKVIATDLGIKIVKKAMDYEDELAYSLSNISIAYRNICVRRQLDMELWNAVD